VPICADCQRETTRRVRDMCLACYQRHLRALKKAGTYQSRHDSARLPVQDRILKKTTPGWGGCIIWTGTLSLDGYGIVRAHAGRLRVAHRVLYEVLIGSVPVGLELDHTCHTESLDCPGGKCIHRRCVNPNHLEPVTPEENRLRGKNQIVANAFKTHCPHGHPYDEANTYWTTNGQRACKECRRAQRRRWHAKSYVKRPRVQEDRTHCRNGHPQDESTVFFDSDGRRRCRECRKQSSRRSKARKRQERKASEAKDRARTT
jgi:hypothetical protein